MSDKEEFRIPLRAGGRLLGEVQYCEGEFELRRRVAECLLGEVPDWVPASVRKAAPISLSIFNPGAVLRLLTDQRMKTVWRTLRGQDATKLENLFVSAAGYVNLIPPAIPAHRLELARSRHLSLAKRIEELADELGAHRIGGEMHSRALQELIAECRSRAKAPSRGLSFLVVDRARGDNKVRSYLAALVTFTNKSFGTPHYSTVATIARVALNKRDHEITVKMVRDANRHTKAVSAARRGDTPSAL